MNELQIDGFLNAHRSPYRMDGSSDDTLQETIERFQCHSSVAKVRTIACSLQSFSFHQVTSQEMFDQLIKLDPKKATPQEAIPPKILQENADLFSSPLTAFFNKLVVESTFPDELKLANISSLYKKDDRMRKQNYRPISLLQAISKIFDRIIYNQLIDYLSAFLSPLLGGFRKGCSTERVLLNFLQACKASLDKKELAGTILMDLSKAFDVIDHELLIAKLAAYGLGWDALKLIKNYLTNVGAVLIKNYLTNVAAVLAIQHFLGHLATLFQHETKINPAIAGSMLG